MSYIDLARAERRSVQRTGLGDRRRTGMPSILRDERSAEAGQIPPDLARPMRHVRMRWGRSLATRWGGNILPPFSFDISWRHAAGFVRGTGSDVPRPGLALSSAHRHVSERRCSRRSLSCGPGCREFRSL